MKRLAIPIIVLLLLFGAVGAVWAIFAFLDQPQTAATTQSDSTRQQSDPMAEASDALSAGIGEQRSEASHQNSGATFDVARIDPEGTSVFAGRAKPGDSVTIMADGAAIGTTEADENGEWTFAVDHPFASADPKLALRAGPAPAKPQQKVAKADTTAASDEPIAPKPGKRGSASEVTTQLLKNLEGMVETARVEQQEKSAPETPAAAAPGPTVPEPTAPGPTAPKTTAPETTVSGPTVAGSKVPEPTFAPGAPGEPAATAPATAQPTAPTALPESEPERSSVANLATTPQATPKAADQPTPKRKSVPVPITFVFNEATFTEDGRKAASLLLEYLRLKHYDSVILTGHADERGTDALNMDLSRERLETVASFLKDGGYEGRLDLVPKGETEPFTGVVRSEYDRDELWQLDRRVELVISQ
ncbi:OmpA family protein [Methylocystis sp.]|uniref:OmpA family protein n=1 Tax=Methylocystis sp. TaxID=1911079 RepID=UPI003DA1D615